MPARPTACAKAIAVAQALSQCEGGSWGVGMGVRDVSRNDRRNSYPIWQEFASPSIYKIPYSDLV